MTLTETTLGQQVDPPAMEPSQSAWLPLTAGDQAALTRQAAPEHGWPASIFIFLSNLTAFGLAAGALGTAIALLVALFSGEWPFAGFMVLATAGLALGAVVQRGLAQHVKNFSRWGWYGAMAELAFVTLSKVNVLITEPEAAAGAVVGIVVDLLWMGYFWNHRADFDVDIGS